MNRLIVLCGALLSCLQVVAEPQMPLKPLVSPATLRMSSAPNGSSVLSSHPRLTIVQLQDATDQHNELVFTTEYLLAQNEKSFDVTAPAIFWEDALTGEGKAYFRQAPLPHARTDESPDFHIDPITGVTVLSSSYPCVEVSYSGGRFGRVRAATDFQRKLRPYVPGRDGLFLSNTWGDGNRDACINEAFMLREVNAGSELGVEVIQIDDGWQKGRSANSAALKKGDKGRWGSWWDLEGFWDVDPERFPHGLEPVVAAAREKGMKFGLWFGPDSTDEAKYWEKDADFLLSMHRRLGIDYFKLDSMKTTTKLALERQTKLMDRLVIESEGKLTIDLDVTAGIRPGYYGFPKIGPVFVENRYVRPKDTRLWWPHLTLRNLWSLAHVVDPARLRMEVLNPTRHQELYPASDPLSPIKWPKDAIFAISMYASPLGWFEIQNLPDEVTAAWKPLVRRWKRERDAIHAGYVYPIGNRPDGVSWTGFVSIAKDGRSGTVLIFRELAENDAAAFDLSALVSGDSLAVEVIGGRGRAAVAGGTLSVSIPAKLDYVWVRFAGRDACPHASAITVQRKVSLCK